MNNLLRGLKRIPITFAFIATFLSMIWLWFFYDYPDDVFDNFFGLLTGICFFIIYFIIAKLIIWTIKGFITNNTDNKSL